MGRTYVWTVYGNRRRDIKDVTIVLLTGRGELDDVDFLFAEPAGDSPFMGKILIIDICTRTSLATS
jgi:hypothetical protein